MPLYRGNYLPGHPKILSYRLKTVSCARQLQRQVFSIARSIVGDLGNTGHQNRLTPLHRAAGHSSMPGPRCAPRLQPSDVMAIIEGILAVYAYPANQAATNVRIERLRLHGQDRESL